MADEQTTIRSAQDPGKTLVEWTFPEFVRYERSRTWHIVMLTIAGLALVWSIFTANFLFGLIIVMVTAIYFLQSRRPPQTLTATIAENGIRIGNSFTPYRDLRDFWIIYRPPEVKRLYLRYKNALRPAHAVSLQSQNPVKVRASLLRSLKEDLSQEEEPAFDQISRTLKI